MDSDDIQHTQLARACAHGARGIQIGDHNSQYNVHTSAPPPSAIASNLRRDNRAFTGRDHELRRIFDAVAQAANSGDIVAVHSINGMPGVGKTAFVVHAANQLADQFPDGQLFLDLHSHTDGRHPVDPLDALASLLTAIGVEAHFLPVTLDDRAALWRAQLVDKRLLVILDNAASSSQVEPLLPGAAGCLVLVTSRRRLAALPAVSLPLTPLPSGEATQMFTRLAPQSAGESTKVIELVGLAGFLPLAIALLAGLFNAHPVWSVGDLLAWLKARKDTFARLKAEDYAVAAAFDLSYRNLSSEQQRLFRLLSLHPGTDLDAHAAAALCDISMDAAIDELEALYDQHLIDEISTGRYRMHDLIRCYAKTLVAAVPLAEREAALVRLFGYYEHAAATADLRLTRHTRTAPSSMDSGRDLPELSRQDRAAAWMRAERANLTACIRYAIAQQQDNHVVGLTGTIASFLRGEGPWDHALQLHGAAVDAARRIGDDLARVGALIDLGVVWWFAGDDAHAIGALEQALALSMVLNHRLGEANALTELGAVLQTTGRYKEAGAKLEQALSIYAELGDQLGQANALTHLGALRCLMGRYPEAAEGLNRALAIYRETGQRIGEAVALSDQAAVRQALGDHKGAVQALDAALVICRSLSHRRGEANALARLGSVRRAHGDYVGAAGVLELALEAYQKLGHRLGEAKTLNHMGALLMASGQAVEAHDHHQRALELSREIDNPLEQARAMEGTGRSILCIADTTTAVNQLRHAYALYVRIGAAEAEQLAVLLAEHAAGQAA